MPWQVLLHDFGILAVHAALLSNGKILYFGGDQHSEDEHTPDHDQGDNDSGGDIVQSKYRKVMA